MVNDELSAQTATGRAVRALVQELRRKYHIPVDNVRGHRELAGNSTVCPGPNFDPAQLRASLRAADEAEITPTPSPPLGDQPQVGPGQHVLILPDTDKYLNAAMAYIWKFQPDVTFALSQTGGRWPYITAVGNPEHFGNDQLNRLRTGGAKLVQHIPGDPPAALLGGGHLRRHNLGHPLAG